MSKNFPKSSKVYQVIQAPLLCKTVVFANGERIKEANEVRMTKKYPLKSTCEVLYKSVNHKMNDNAVKLTHVQYTRPESGCTFVSAD